MDGPLAAVLAVLAAAALAALWHLRRRFLVVTVRGTSMRPTLQPGERVLVDRRRAGLARAGDVVAARLPGGDVMYLKRLAAVPGDPVPEGVSPAGADGTVPPGMVALLGDNAYSLDSRAWGCVRDTAILGVMVRPMRRPRCARRPGRESNPR